MTPQFGASLTDYARLVIYDRIMFITQGTDVAWYKKVRMREKKMQDERYYVNDRIKRKI